MMRLPEEMHDRFDDWQRSITFDPRKYGADEVERREREQSEIRERQRSFEAVVHGGPASLGSYLREQIGISADHQIDAPALVRTPNASEFRDTTLDLEIKMFDAWRTLTPHHTSQPLYWTLCYIVWLEGDQIDVRLADALLAKTQGGGRETEIENATRNALRRIGGLPSARGKVSVLSDSTMGRAWWRGFIAAEIAEHSHGELDAAAAHEILHASNQAWETLVGRAVKSLTVINHPAARAAIVCQFAGVTRDNNKIDGHRMDHLVRDAAQALAQYGLTRSLSHVPWRNLRAVVAKTVENAVREDAEPDAASDDEPPEPPQPSRRPGIFSRLRGSAGPDP